MLREKLIFEIVARAIKAEVSKDFLLKGIRGGGHSVVYLDIMKKFCRWCLISNLKRGPEDTDLSEPMDGPPGESSRLDKAWWEKRVVEEKQKWLSVKC